MPLPAIPTSIQGLQQAVLTQDRIGWTNAFEGRWCSDWLAVQQTYLEYIKSKQSAKRWLIAITKKFWDTASGFWIDRNGENAKRKSARIRAELYAKMHREFDAGYDSLYLKHHW